MGNRIFNPFHGEAGGYEFCGTHRSSDKGSFMGFKKSRKKSTFRVHFIEDSEGRRHLPRMRCRGGDKDKNMAGPQLAAGGSV